MINRRMQRSGLLKKSRGSIRILVFGDVHMTKNDDDQIGGVGKYFYTAEQKMRYMINMQKNEPFDMVVGLGDFVDDHTGEADFDRFMKLWNEIDTPKEMTIGNHEFDGVSYEQIVDKLGYTNEPFTAGSHFNKSFTVDKDGQSVRVILMDSNFESIGGGDRDHANVYSGRYSDSFLHWFENEIQNSFEDVIFLISHHNTHYGGHFRQGDTQDMLNVILENNKKVYAVSGHTHPLYRDKKAVVHYDNYGENFPGINLGEVVNGQFGACFTFVIHPNGKLEIIPMYLRYP